MVKKDKFKKDILTKTMDYLSMRDHSKSELREKLRRKDYKDLEIEAALHIVEEKGWLLPPEELAEKVSLQLHLKKKSHSYIDQYLRSKELPSVAMNAELELEKALEITKSRFSTLSNASDEDKKQIARILKTRGFDSETISRLIHETL